MFQIPKLHKPLMLGWPKKKQKNWFNFLSKDAWFYTHASQILYMVEKASRKKINPKIKVRCMKHTNLHGRSWKLFGGLFYRKAILIISWHGWSWNRKSFKKELNELSFGYFSLWWLWMFARKSNLKSSSCLRIIIVGRFFSEGHFDPFYGGLYGHKTIHHSK